MAKRIFLKINSISHNIFHNITATRADRRVFEKFDNKTGLIYFGAVDQRHDEVIIRGFTSSSTHQDNHFSVGTVDDYNASLVNRSDAVLDDNGNVQFNNWIIASIELKTNLDLPHIFINANNQNERHFKSFFKLYPILSKINLGIFENYCEEFTSRFSMFSAPADVIKAEKIFPSASSRVIASHLWPYSVEIQQGYVYVYCSTEKVSYNDLSGMLNIGLWLARYIDSRIEQI